MANSEKVSPALQSLLAPVAVAGYALAAWRLGQDLNITGKFFIEEGLLSRWQVWLAMAVATQVFARRMGPRVPEARS